MDSKSQTYDLRGVSSLKEDVAAAVKNISHGEFPNAFCQAIANPFSSTSIDSLFLSHADGTGSKSVIAYMIWKETGDLSVFRSLAQDAIVMNTDDLMCVGCIDNFYFTSTIARNKHRIPGEILSSLIEGMNEFMSIMRDQGFKCQLLGGETADLGDAVKTLILDMNASTFISKKKFIDTDQIKPGLAIVGLTSFGQAVYEPAYNSGIASNGLTSARHDLLAPIYRSRYPETYDELIPRELVYHGRFQIEDKLPGTELTVGQALLSPTRSYLPVVKKILEEYPEAVKAIIHLTGGGQTKCLKFGKGIHYVKNHLFDLPPLFRILAQSPLYQESPEELYKVFNCGHRLEIYLEEKWVDAIVQISESFGVQARMVGYTESNNANRDDMSHRPSNSLSILVNNQTYLYQS